MKLIKNILQVKTEVTKLTQHLIKETNSWCGEYLKHLEQIKATVTFSGFKDGHLGLIVEDKRILISCVMSWTKQNMILYHISFSTLITSDYCSSSSISAAPHNCKVFIFLSTYHVELSAELSIRVTSRSHPPTHQSQSGK